MEKNKPACPLSVVKRLVEDGKVKMTGVAKVGAFQLGFRGREAITEILKLESTEFYKSMTTYGDSTLWQDVYRHTSDFGKLYIKLTVVDDVLIVSFKEL